MRTKKGDDRKVTLVASSPRDQLQPKTSTYDYLKPGDKIPITKPYLYDVLLHQGTAIEDDLFPNPWSLNEVQWQPDSRHFTFLYNQRGHQVTRLVTVDAATGEPSTVVEETPKTFVDYSNKIFSHFTPDRSELIWMSEPGRVESSLSGRCEQTHDQESDHQRGMGRPGASTGLTTTNARSGSAPGASTRSRTRITSTIAGSTSTAPGSST